MTLWSALRLGWNAAIGCPEALAPFEKKTFLSHTSLKRKRGVGFQRDASPKGHLTGDRKTSYGQPGLSAKERQVPARGRTTVRSRCTPNPSLALQASHIFPLLVPFFATPSSDKRPATSS